MKPTTDCQTHLLRTAIAILAGSIAHADEVDIKFITPATATTPDITTTYKPFSTDLPASTAAATTWTWLNADNSPANTDIRATQRSLGFREVDYKAIFSQQVTLSQVTPTSAGGITTYDYSAQNNKAVDLVGFWRNKDLPIIIGPDGKAYIADGHHTTAGYLAAVTAPREVIPGLGHVVLGHAVANYYDPANPVAVPNDAWWTARESENNGLLYGTNGNQLTRFGEPGYSGLQPILPSTLAMPTVPCEASMENSDYRALTWGMADGIALAKSEVYRDQYGRTLLDYDSPLSSNNTKNWAHDSASAGRLAKATDTYNMYLLDDSTIQDDITPSVLSAANNNLHIDTTTGQTISGVIANFGASVEINKGTTIATQWKETALNKPAFNSTLTIPHGTGTVTFTAANTYTGETTVAASTLALTGAGSIAQSVKVTVNSGATLDVSATTQPFVVTAPQTLRNNGNVLGAVDVLGTVGGSGIFQSPVTLESGAHLSPGNSPGVITFASGLTLKDGSVLDFDIGAISDKAIVSGGAFFGSDPASVLVNFTYSPTFIPGSAYTLLDWTGASASNVDAADFYWNDTTPGNSVAFAVVGNTLQATVVSEPGIFALLAIGLPASLGRRHRA